jgi:hypothetical protein
VRLFWIAYDSFSHDVESSGLKGWVCTKLQEANFSEGAAVRLDAKSHALCSLCDGVLSPRVANLGVQGFMSFTKQTMKRRGDTLRDMSQRVLSILIALLIPVITAVVVYFLERSSLPVVTGRPSSFVKMPTASNSGPTITKAKERLNLSFRVGSGCLRPLSLSPTDSMPR